MEYMTVKEAAAKWNITPRHVQLLCSKGKIPDVIRFGRSWAIPVNSDKPKDGRRK